jgi:hypothetical protein
MNRSRLVPQGFDHAREAPFPTTGVCPACGRPDALRTARTDDGRRVTCRFADGADATCDWPGVDRPFRRPSGDALPGAFVERLGRIAERVVDECVAEGSATARIDPQYVTSMRSALRRAARDRDVQVRTTHVGDGRIEVKVC